MLLPSCVSQLYSTSDAVLLYPVSYWQLGGVVWSHCVCSRSSIVAKWTRHPLLWLFNLLQRVCVVGIECGPRWLGRRNTATARDTAAILAQRAIGAISPVRERDRGRETRRLARNRRARANAALLRSLRVFFDQPVTPPRRRYCRGDNASSRRHQ